MRRDFRKNTKENKILVYSIVGVLAVISIIFAIISYSNSLNENVNESKLSQEQIAKIVNENQSESASSSLGKSIEEMDLNNKQIEKNEIKENKAKTNNTTTSNNIKTENTVKNNSTTKTSEATKQTSSTKKSNTEKATNTNIEKKAEETIKKELKLQKPIEGDITNQFAKENLIYSETLQEWVTHNGIDIKADKGTVVQAAEDGTIKSIKNDPRFGLTVIIEHNDGIKTVYANLLSAEFITEGETVVKGQSIGTVGNTAAFESADEPHLHFEVIKDDIQVDPNIYLK